MSNTTTTKTSSEKIITLKGVTLTIFANHYDIAKSNQKNLLTFDLATGGCLTVLVPREEMARTLKNLRKA
jgi:hypothetical protein